MANPKVTIRRVNFLWYLAPVVPILALGYAGLVGWLPSWMLMLAVFAFFMWLFSLAFTTFAVLTRRNKEPRQ